MVSLVILLIGQKQVLECDENELRSKDNGSSERHDKMEKAFA